MKVVGFGPVGLVGDVLGAVLSASLELVGPVPGSGLKPSPAEVAAADCLLLWLPAAVPTPRILDAYHELLVVATSSRRASERPVQRIVLVSHAAHAWAATPALGRGSRAVTLREDDYAARRPWRACAGVAALEQHVIRLHGLSRKGVSFSRTLLLRLSSCAS